MLGRLEREARAILIAYYLDGIPMVEIADQRGIPVSTAYKWRRRALGALRRILEQNGS